MISCLWSYLCAARARGSAGVASSCGDVGRFMVTGRLLRVTFPHEPHQSLLSTRGSFFLHHLQCAEMLAGFRGAPEVQLLNLSIVPSVKGTPRAASSSQFVVSLRTSMHSLYICCTIRCSSVNIIPLICYLKRTLCISKCISERWNIMERFSETFVYLWFIQTFVTYFNIYWIESMIEIRSHERTLFTACETRHELRRWFLCDNSIS